MRYVDLVCADATIIAIAGVVAVVLVALFIVLKRRRRTADELEPSDAGEGLPAPTGAKADPARPAPETAAAPEPDEPAPTEEKVEEEEEERDKTLEEGLGRTRKEGFVAKLGSLFSGKKIDEDLLDELEEVLFTADIGVRTADQLIGVVRAELSKKELRNADKVWGLLRGEAQRILDEADAEGETPTAPEPPLVVLVLGVNGTGKTTSIGKLAHTYCEAGRSVQLVAGDTFRAAAAEQLEVWGRRVGVTTYRGKEEADPASVVFDGVRKAKDDGVDVVLVDTAGRLHTQKNLMDELKKVRRVIGKAHPGAPHEVLMVLDATTGQNAIQQARMFREVTEASGIVLTKLDGTAKGGVVLGICAELKIPIKYVGIGERLRDLRPFRSEEFVDALFPRV